jgi:uncharacterized repeat protein (TIGR01451 family)
MIQKERPTFDESSKTRIMKRFLFAFILFWLIAGSLAGQNTFWEKGVGPYGWFSSIVPTYSNIAYTYNLFFHTFYKSIDYGEHWSAIEVSQPDETTPAESYHIGRSGIFYCVVKKTIGDTTVRSFYRSLDEGASWELRDNPFQLIRIFETPSGALVGFDSNSKLYRSSDTGISWQLTADLNIYISYSFDNLLSGNDGILMIAGYGSKLAYSLDDGQSWNLGGSWDSTSNWFINRLCLTPSGVLFLARYDRHPGVEMTILYSSTDWGFTWVPVDIEMEHEQYLYNVLQLPDGRLLMGSSQQLFFSENDGLSWETLPGTAEHAGFFSINTVLSNGDIIGENGEGLVRSSDGGTTWIFSTYGIQYAKVQQLSLLTDSLQLAFTYNNLWRTTTAGSTWERLLNDTTVFHSSSVIWPERPLAVINKDSFAVSLGTKLVRTTDGGQNFSEITPSGKLFNNYLFKGNQGLFTNGQSGVLMSADFGLSWQNILPDKTILRLEQHPAGSLFAVMVPADWVNDNDARFYRSNDNGNTWEIMSISGLPETTTALHLIISDNGDLYLTGFTGEPYWIAFSNDLGSSWTVNKIPYGGAYGPVAVNALDHLFTMAGDNQDLYESVDRGASWYQLPESSFGWLNGLEISPAGYLYALPQQGEGLYRSSQSTLQGGYIRGSVRRDADMDCSTPDAQQPLQNWIVELTGEQNYVANTSASGQYAVFADSGQYEVRARVSQDLWWSLCDSIQTVSLNLGQTIDNTNFIAVGEAECPLMMVDVVMPHLDRCFDNIIYIAYCNVGTEAADSAWVDVELDPYLSFLNSMQPYTSLGNNVYRFYLGNVNWGDCGQFYLRVLVNCDSTVIGQTHCVAAHAFPDTLCNPVPNWSGATIEANATCQDSIVHLQLQNITPVPSAMLDYIIIEDDVVLLSGQKQYNDQEIIQFEYPANGHTWRIESKQEPGHPFSRVALAFLEGCGGFQTLGYINQFSVNGWTPSVNQECVENTGSFDPNDKQGFPTGFGDTHRIRPGQALEYLIRFQNTGTDTAFTVQIRDTLSAWLDAATIRPGASSHPYTWNLSGPGVLTFRFDNIMLPDSNVNLTGSQGFVSFWIDQKPEVPLETQILNTAAIYFDFNAPVITNQTLHTVGIDYLTAVKDFEKQDVPTIGVQPNPAEKETLVSLPPDTERLMLFDAQGRSLRVLQVRGAAVRLERGNLPAGMYGLRAENRRGAVTGVGKVVWK